MASARNILSGIGQGLTGISNTIAQADQMKQKKQLFDSQMEGLKLQRSGLKINSILGIKNKKLRKMSLLSDAGKKAWSDIYGSDITPEKAELLNNDEVSSALVNVFKTTFKNGIPKEGKPAELFGKVLSSLENLDLDPDTLLKSANAFLDTYKGVQGLESERLKQRESIAREKYLGRIPQPKSDKSKITGLSASRTSAMNEWKIYDNKIKIIGSKIDKLKSTYNDVDDEGNPSQAMLKLQKEISDLMPKANAARKRYESIDKQIRGVQGLESSEQEVIKKQKTSKERYDELKATGMTDEAIYPQIAKEIQAGDIIK